MFRWLLICALVCVGGYYGLAYFIGPLPLGFGGDDTWKQETEQTGKEAEEHHAEKFQHYGDPASETHGGIEPIVVSGARILVDEKQEVPAEREGKLLFIATEYKRKPGEPLPPNVIEESLGFLAVEVEEGAFPEKETFTFPGEPGKRFCRWDDTMQMVPGKIRVARVTMYFRKLSVGDWVDKGDLVALINPKIAMDELTIKVNAFAAKEAARRAAVKTRVEAKLRYQAAFNAAAKVGARTDTDEIRGAELAAERLLEEERQAELEVKTAQSELNASYNILKMYVVRAMVPGVIKIIYRNAGDAVQNLQPIMQIQNTKQIRVEGLVGIQHADTLEKGMQVTVEATQPDSPRTVLEGHRQAVTCIAVSRDERPVILSGSEDSTIRGWDSVTGRPLWVFRDYPTAVLSLACTTGEAKQNLAVAGFADGSARLYNLAKIKDKSIEFSERHRGGVNAVAFSPDGTLCATTGEDRRIFLWDVTTRKRKATIDNAHRASITSLTFATNKELVSAGRDNRLIVWDLTSKQPKEKTEFTRRSGDVTHLNTDGKRVLFDQGQSLRIQTLANREIEGLVENTSGSSNFSTLALFSPDGKTIMTTGAKEGQLQLWKTPEVGGRGAEIRHYVWEEAVTSGAFSPDGKFVVTGDDNGDIVVWTMPSQEEIDKRLTAEISLIERYLDSSTLQVRIWADLKEYPEWLVPGAAATMVIDPAKQP